MNQELWTAVDDYFDALLHRPDPALDAALQASEAGGLPQIQVAPNQGKLLWILARSLNARRILEVGTLGGYSTIWLARALAPGGHLITLELMPNHAEIARANFVTAGLDDRIELRVGSAVELLPALASEGGASFDLVFIDADKENTITYFEWVLKMVHPGSLIIVDNVVRSGKVIDPHEAESRVQGVRRAMDRISAEPRVSATALQTVGSKGYDGLVLAYVIG
ncbi:MAG: O-methyltransferase [Chloroflexi bacterium]|nr:O-methyltransferase [Chloroflexota bacterium]